MKGLAWASAFLVVAILLALLCGLLMPNPPAPTPEPPTARPSETVAPPTLPPTATPRPTETPEPSPTATPAPPVTATPEPYVPRPSPTPQPTLALRGMHRVRPGDTLWDIACLWYGDMPLRPNANPLTPCTCWPGIYWASPQLHPPQLIYPGEQYGIPLVCGQ